MRFNFVGIGLVTLGLAGFSFGCSSSSSGSGDDGGTTGKQDDAGKGKDAGKGGKGDDGGGGGDDAGGGGQATSDILVSGAPVEDGGVGYMGAVIANIDPHYRSGLKCRPPTMSGGCQIDDCTPVLTAKNPGPTVDDNAGTITVTGGDTGSSVVLKFGSDDTYSSSDTTQLTFTEGDTFTVKATGGAFPAFSGTSDPAPAVVTLTSPMPASTDLLGRSVYAIDLTKALTWSWTGGSADSQVVFGVVNISTNFLVTCSFDATAGTGTIPADAVAKFPTGTTTIPQPLIIYTVSTKTLSAGGSSVLFQVQASSVALQSVAFSTE